MIADFPLRIVITVASQRLGVCQSFVFGWRTYYVGEAVYRSNLTTSYEGEGSYAPSDAQIGVKGSPCESFSYDLKHKESAFSEHGDSSNVQETASTFNTLQNSSSFYAAIGTSIASFVGVLDISNAIEGEDLDTGRRLSGGERVLSAATGVFDLVTTATGGLGKIKDVIRATGGCNTSLGKMFPNCCFTEDVQVMLYVAPITISTDVVDTTDDADIAAVSETFAVEDITAENVVETEFAVAEDNRPQPTSNNASAQEATLSVDSLVAQNIAVESDDKPSAAFYWMMTTLGAAGLVALKRKRLRSVFANWKGENADSLNDEALTAISSELNSTGADVSTIRENVANVDLVEVRSELRNEVNANTKKEDVFKREVQSKQVSNVMESKVLDWFGWTALALAFVSLLFGLNRDISSKRLPQPIPQAVAVELESVATEDRAVETDNAQDVLSEAAVAENVTTDILDPPSLVADAVQSEPPSEPEKTSTSDRAPESNVTTEFATVTESVETNENAIENVKPNETPLPTTPQIYTKKISDVKIGKRAVGTNPQGANPLESDETIFERVKHCGYKLCYQKANGTYCHINLLRPEDWLDYEEIQLRDRNTGKVLDELDFQLVEFSPLNFFDYDDCEIEVWGELPEMGVVGWAKLEDVDENVSVQPGPGNVVTGTFAHISDDVIDLQIEGQDKPIGCTSNHPFWSVDRQDFVDAGELQEGERVQLYNGETKRVVQKLPRPGPQNVYNLEIYSEHAYRVTLDGVLVHNDRCGEINLEKTLEKGLKKDPYYLGSGRPHFRKDSKLQVISEWDSPEAASYLADKNVKLSKEYAYGHRSGFEYWRLKQWAQDHHLTRKQWNDFFNHPSFYQVEDAVTNSSHINENKDKYVDLTDAIINHLGGDELVKLFGKDGAQQIFGKKKLKDVLGEKEFNRLFKKSKKR